MTRGQTLQSDQKEKLILKNLNTIKRFLAEVPNLLKEINLNRNNFHPMSVPSTKLYALTFLRAGALTRLQWRWINKVDCILCLEILGDTCGSKEIKAKKIIYRITYPSQKRYKRFLMFLNCIKMRVTLSLYL